MNYLSVAEMAKKWNISERTVRNYCASGKIPGAFLTGKTWNIPDNAERPDRINKKNDMPETLIDRLREEKTSHTKGGIYHKIQIDLTYNSNHIEGNRLTHDQTYVVIPTEIDDKHVVRKIKQSRADNRFVLLLQVLYCNSCKGLVKSFSQ